MSSNNVFDRLFKQETASSLSLKKRTSALSERVAVSKVFYGKGMRRAKAKAKKKVVQECEDNVDTRLTSTPNAASVGIGIETTENDKVEKESINDVLSEGSRIEEEGPSQSEIRRSALKLNISSRYNPEYGFFFSFEES
jgi:hypothetical protein